MMDLSPVAAEVLAAIRTQQDLPFDSMVRLANGLNGEELHISFVEEPDPDDQVSEAYGLRYAVAGELADRLGDAMLDFQPDDENPSFVLRRN